MTTTKSPRSYRRGSVILVLYPDSNLRTAKLRPAMVVQANHLKTGLAQVIVSMITSNMSRGNHPCRVTIMHTSAEGRHSGLLADSVVMTDNLATIADSEIDRVIGRLPMAQVDAALRHTLAL